jgi:hypothetical protein
VGSLFLLPDIFVRPPGSLCCPNRLSQKDFQGLGGGAAAVAADDDVILHFLAGISSSYTPGCYRLLHQTFINKRQINDR